MSRSLSRSSVRTGLGVGAALLVTVVGCSGSSSDSAAQSTGASSAAPGSAAQGSAAQGSAAAEFPVEVLHEFGTTTVAAAPQRVVTIGFNEQDFALALGVTPVGVREFFGYDYQNRPWAKDLLAGATLPEVGGQELNVESVAAQNPDLILGAYSFIDEPMYDKLSALAPTVGDLVPAEGVSSASWQEQLAADAAALGKSAQGQQLTADLESRFAAEAAANPAFAGKKLAVVFPTSTDYYILETEDLRARFFTDLGFAAPPTTGPVTFEQASMLDQDVLAVVGSTEADFLAANPLVKDLPVVQEGRAVYLGEFSGDFAGALGFGSPLSLPFALDIAVPRLAAAADGDPATTAAVD